MADEKKVPLPDEAFEMVAGGVDLGQGLGDCLQPCPKCGSDDVTALNVWWGDKNIYYDLLCNNCGNKWTYVHPQ